MSRMAWDEHCLSLSVTSDYTSSAVCGTKSVALYLSLSVQCIIITSYFRLPIRPVISELAKRE